MFYYTYKITCLKGSWKGKFSFGQHTTNNINDGYFSSSKKICDYKKKYGIENCYREILNFYNSPEELNQAEYELIHPWLNHPDCLNLMEGGHGGCPSDESIDKISKKLIGHKVKVETRQKIREKLLGTKRSTESIEKIRAALTGYKFGPCREETKRKISDKLKGTKRSLESRQKQSKTNKGKQCPTKGKHRVYDNVEKTKFHFE